MSTRKPTALSELLKKGDGLLEQLRAGAAKADRTLSAVRLHLPEDLADKVWGASCKDGTLTLLVQSSAWGARLRYRASELSGDVSRELGVPIEKVTVKVRPRA
jgi:predicted nucleic acid-binding Zn ribbon protein